MKRIGIKGGRIVDPFTGRDCLSDLVLEGPVIARLGDSVPMEDCDEILSAEGCIVAPGLVDGHVHFRDPGYEYKEDIETGAEAAKRGGFTTVIMMANTNPPISTPEHLKENLEKGKKTGIHVLQAGTITMDLKGKELTNMEALRAAGAAAFTDDGIPLMDEKLLWEAMRRASSLGRPVSLHEEDPAFVESLGINQGKVSREMGLGGASACSEEVMVSRDLVLAEDTGCPVVIQHISSGRSVELVREAKKRGVCCFAEVTPHHFTLTEEDVRVFGTNARMNPPLRTSRDRDEIRRGLADGTIDMIATDHAPHAAWEKEKPFAQAPSGIIGLETSLSLGITMLVNEGILSMMELMNKMSRMPAKVYHLLRPNGILAGGAADLVIFDPEGERVVTGFASKSSNSPFLGWKLKGMVKATICEGNIVYRDGFF